MTLRALVIGLLLGLGAAAFGYLNDWVLQQSYIASDLVPVSVYGGLVIGLLVINPLLWFVRRVHLSGREWAVIASLALVGCVVPGPGMMWTFSQTLVRPNHFQRTNIAWKSKNLLGYARTPQGEMEEVQLSTEEGTRTIYRPEDPETLQHVMLVVPESDQAYDRIVNGFSQGLRQTQGELISADRVPWSVWLTPLSFWLPLLGLGFVAGICLVLVIHRQWAYRERLRYPVADFASELIAGAEEHPLANILRNPRFWLGFAPVVVILGINGLQAWYPGSIAVPTSVDFRALAQKWPWLNRMPWRDQILNPPFFFAAIGFAYFVSTEVSFSLGISLVAWGFVHLALLEFGADMNQDYLAGGLHSFQLFGSYLGMALMIAYVGRKFYASVLSRAFFMPFGDPVDRHVTWACRVALLCALGMVLLLVYVVNMDWLLAVLFVMLSGVAFLMTTRINVETGLFFIQPTWHAVGILAGLFGVAALGPNMLFMLALLAAVVTIDPRVAVMPLAANALRFSEAEGVRPARLSRWMILVVLLAMVIGVFSTLYVQYNYGGTQHDWLSMPGEMAMKMLDRNLSEFPGVTSDDWVPFDLSRFNPDPTFLWSAGAGLAVVLACSMLRLRYHWWPLHPIIFLVWGTFPMAMMAASFLLGCVIKVVVTKFGGGQTYHRNKPLFVGLVAGEFVAGIAWAVVNLIYYLNTGLEGKLFRVHP